MTMQYTGGYFLLNDKLVRAEGGNAHTANDLSQLSNYTVRATNLVQETPWMVNPFTMSIASKLFVVGQNLDFINRKGENEIALRVEEPINPKIDPFKVEAHSKTAEEWEEMTTKDRQRFSEVRSKIMGEYEEELGVYRAVHRIYELAAEMSVFDKFFFPHNLDFRTRLYPIPNDLTPQGQDFAKGLLQFAKPKPLGEDGLYWLAFMVATHAGEDKLHPDDREQWSQDNFDMICQHVDDPWQHRGWVQMDKPFQYLAAAHSYVWAIRSGMPEKFLCHIPINLDGSCNGAQHLSIMGRDMVGAKATNCCADDERQDLYMEVADRVLRQVTLDASKGNEVASLWLPALEDPSDRRKVVKRSVMTVPYGVTQGGIAEFMKSDKHIPKEIANKTEGANYIRDIIWASIGQTLEKGQKIQMWFSECATICAEAGLPFVWDTPAGSKITQSYMNLIHKRVKCHEMRFHVFEEPQEGENESDFRQRVGMVISKMATAAPPNVVHGNDASHLQITVCRLGDMGITDFSMIHDSFGTHACDVTLMRDIIRQTAVDMYSGNWLQQFKESVEHYSGLTMPDHPPLGDFDINEILDSDYFFA